MSLIISVYCNEGIVLASESRTTQTISTDTKERSFPFSDNAHKTFETPNGYGLSTCGAASINGQPIAGYIERFIGSYDYTRGGVKEFSEELGKAFSKRGYSGLLIFHIAGYDRDVKGVPTERLFRLVLDSGKLISCSEITAPDSSGAVWDGVTEIMTRLIKEVVVPSHLFDATNVTFVDKTNGNAKNLADALVIQADDSSHYEESTISWGLFSLQDAIDFSRFGIRTTIDAQRFLSTEKTVGGPIDILVIRPDGAQWISQKVLK